MDIQPFLELSAARHSHLCPRQVLGVRMGMLAGKLLGLRCLNHVVIGNGSYFSIADEGLL